MAKDNVIGLAMGLDVTDLKAGIQQVGKILKESRNNFNLATAGMDKWSKSSEGLQAKLNQLESQLDGQKKVVAGYKAEIERVSNMEGDHSKQLEILKEKLQKAEIEVKKTESSIQKYSSSLADVTAENKKAESSLGQLTSEIADQEKALSNLEDEYKDAVLTYGKNSKEAKSLKSDIQKLSDELSENKGKLQSAEKALEAFTAEMEDAEDGAERFQKGLDGIKGLGGLVAKGVTAVGAGITALGASFLATAEGTREFRTNMSKLEAGFETSGLKAEQASETYKALYGVVADEGKATEATAHIAKLAKSQEDLNKWVNISTGVYATFGDSLPIENLAEASNETAKTGKLTGGLADALNWAGINEEKFQEKLNECTSEQERNKLITDTLNSTYDKASKKYQQVNKDVIESNKSQVTLTETMAQLGEKAEPIMTAVKDGFNDILQVVLDLLEGADFEAIQEGIENAFQYFIDEIVPAIKEGFQWILDNKDMLIAGIVGIGTAMMAWNVVTMIQGLVTAFKTWKVATEGMTIAQRALNLVMKANPIGIVITLVTALVSAFIYLWNTSDEFRAFWINLWKKIKDTTDKVVKSISKWFKELWKDIKKVWSETVGWFKNIWTKVSDGFESALNSVSKFFSNAWKSIKSAWSSVISWFSSIGSSISKGFKNATDNVKNFFKKAWDNVKRVWGAVHTWFTNIKTKIVNAFKSIPTNLKTYFTNAWNNVKKVWGTVSSWFTNIKNKIVNAFKSIPSGIKNFFVSAWNNVKNAWSNVTSHFAGIKDKIVDAFKSLPSKMLTVGTDLVKGLWNGVKDMTGWITGKLKSFSNDVLDGIKDFFGIHSPSRKMAEIGTNLIEGLGVGVDNTRKVVIDKFGKIGEEILDEVNKIKEGIDKSHFTDTLKGLGIKVESPFKGWTHAQLNDEVVKLKKEYDSLEKPLENNLRLMNEQGDSVELMNERSKLLNQRIEKQRDLVDVLSYKMEIYARQGVNPAQWATDDLEKFTAELENTIAVSDELSENLHNMADVDNTIEMEAKLDAEPALNSWQDALAFILKNGIDAFDNLSDEINGKMKKAVENIKYIGAGISDIASQAVDLFNQAIDNQIEQLDSELEQFSEMKEKELEVAEERYESEKNMLEQKNRAGMLSDEQYQANLQALEQKQKNNRLAIEQELQTAEQATLRRKNELAQKQFNAQKATNIAEAVMLGARAIMQGFAQLGPIGGGLNAIVQAGLTSAQIAIINQQKYVPMLAKGGIATGATHAIIGEAGKEAVLPLENNTGWMDDLAKKLASIMEKDLSIEGGKSNVISYGDVINNYNYNQTINSPKTLTRKEIYRDTKNLLALKGV